MRGIACLSIALIIFALLVLFAACTTTRPEPTLTSIPGAPVSAESWTSTQAASHIGERGTVCGPVVDTRYATGSKGKPTFLNFDRAYPDHTFVVVIWGSDRGAFPTNPESHYKGEEVCATGLIESYQGKPEIIAKSGSQLEFAR